MKKIKAVMLIFLLGVVLIFIVQNAVTVEIHFLLWHFSMPRALLVMFLLGIGVLIGLIMASITTLRRK